MKSINIDAWFVNFMLSFRGLGPVLIGPKVNFFKLMWQISCKQCAHQLYSTQQKGPTLIKFDLKSNKWAPKSFLGYMNNVSL
jgi:hypothetical protein